MSMHQPNRSPNGEPRGHAPTRVLLVSIALKYETGRGRKCNSHPNGKRTYGFPDTVGQTAHLRVAARALGVW